MNKGLEAVKLLKSRLTNCECIRFGEYITIIETELKRNIELEKQYRTDTVLLGNAYKKIAELEQMIRNFNEVNTTKPSAFKYILDNKTKIKSSFIVFKNSYIKNKDCYSLKQRRKIEKRIKRLEVLLLQELL